jgi:ABC-type lipoprotein export system ATPase subunit
MFAVATGGGSLVLATHDPEVAERCSRVLDLTWHADPAPVLAGQADPAESQPAESEG